MFQQKINNCKDIHNISFFGVHIGRAFILYQNKVLMHI